MNSLTRTLAKIATLQPHQASRRWLALQSFHISTTPKRYTKSKKPSSESDSAPSTEWPRPSKIPYQSKVANSVCLSGYIHMNVQFQAASDGKFWAGTVLSQNPSSDSPPLWIPIIFEGDLAHIAVCHLKENDHVYIDGQLSADPPSSGAPQGQANVQVMVRNINFVDESSPITKSTASPSSSITKSTSSPEEGTLSHSVSAEKGTETGASSWRDLLDNPNEWQDYREKKLNGLVKPKYPDFKHKDGNIALWLDSAPKWVLSKLGGQQFDAPTQNSKSKQVNELKGDGLWMDLVENPSKWWDNRLDKTNGKLKEKYPDFKHKETGKALWLNYSPAWVQTKLPPLKNNKME